MLAAHKIQVSLLVLLCYPSGAAAELWETRLEPLQPRQPRSEIQESRLHAAALYATGRKLFHQGDLAAALKHYQRAWQWYPSPSVVAEIVPLAFSLERPQEAVRYALLSAERSDTDPLLLRRLALYLTEEQDWQRAASLYRKWLAHPETKLGEDSFDTLLVWLEIGRLEYITGETEQASQAFENFQNATLKQSADSPLLKRLRTALAEDLNSTWELCGRVHSLAGNYDQAAEAFAQIELPLQETGRLGYLQAKAELNRDKPLEAWEFLKSYFRSGQNSEGIAPYELLGDILRQLNQSETFVLELAKLQATRPNDPALKLMLGKQLLKSKHPDQGIRLIQSAVQTSAGNEQVLLEGLQTLVEFHTDRGNGADLWEVLAIASEKIDDISLLGEVLTKLTELPKLVDQLLLESQQSGNQQDSAARSLALAAVLLGAGRVEEAHQFYEQSLPADPEEKQQMNLAWGLALMAADQNAQAAEVLQDVLQGQNVEAKDAIVPYYLSAALELAGRTEEALQLADTAANLEPTSAEIANRRPWILYHTKQYEAAADAYEELIEKFDDQHDEATREALRDARLALSNVELELGNRDRAEEWIQQVLDEFPDDVGAMNDIGYLWSEAGKHLHQAHRFATEAVAREPENAAYRDTLGWVLFQQGNVERAIEELTTATELSARGEDGSPGDLKEADGIILDHLGDAHAAIDEMEDARRYWQMASEQLKEDAPEMALSIREKIAEQGTPEAANSE